MMSEVQEGLEFTSIYRKFATLECIGYFLYLWSIPRILFFPIFQISNQYWCNPGMDWYTTDMVGCTVYRYTPRIDWYGPTKERKREKRRGGDEQVGGGRRGWEGRGGE